MSKPRIPRPGIIWATVLFWALLVLGASVWPGDPDRACAHWANCEGWVSE